MYPDEFRYSEKQPQAARNGHLEQNYKKDEILVFYRIKNLARVQNEDTKYMR
jgi:hypothetical protein